MIFRLVLSLSLILPITIEAADNDVDYARVIKPVLRERCYACHGALKREAGLRLDTAYLIRQGGDSGAAITPADVDSSLLIERVTATEDEGRMPPEGAPLTDAQIEALRTWIRQGARAPEQEDAESDPREHWAYLRPRRPSSRADEVAPQSDSPAQINPIDALLAAHHDQQQLKPLPRVSKRQLLRRVYLDLIGLPPDRDEMNTFLNDDRPDAYQRVVRQLLDSPHHGERWARHWMDIWRYTDWYGLGAQVRNSQKHIWHWRDWIVDSLNDDLGYDEMIQRMLAADELMPTDQQALRATGFLARNYYLFNRTTWLDSTIEHTSKALLGITMNCAKCHDHKYDPIRQTDYYRMRAIFEPHQVRLDPVPGETDLEKDGLPRVFDAHPDAVTFVHIRGDEKNPDTTHAVAAGMPDFLASDALDVKTLALPAAARWPALQAFVLADQLRIAQREIETAQRNLDDSQSQLAAAKAADQQVANEESRESSGTIEDIFLKDDFDEAQPRHWHVGPGQWEYKDGRLLQSQTGFARAYLRTLADHPADFEAILKFTTVGGETYRSVGIAFDVTEDQEKLVYLSSVSPGSKLQISYKTNGKQAYPGAGKQDRMVEVNRPYELNISVRGKLVNVALDGDHALAYELPIERRTGKIELVAFDAAVEFDSLSVRALPATVTLVPAGGGKAPPSVAQATLATALAEKILATAERRPAALRTAHEADCGKQASPPPEDLAQRIEQAAVAARRYELAKAEETVLRAEQKRSAADDKTQPTAEKELAAARTAVEKARQAIEQPGDQYTSLRVSLKALEGPAESESSQRQPYPETSTGRRTALAQWITDRDNPLTARVAVNHIWMRHFGQPLVESVSDFGRRAPPPAMQDLLDWLAVELMEQSWSMKHLHELIVTSEAYQRTTSTVTADAATMAADPKNVYFWRCLPRRMESQIIRDSLLRLAGVLDTQLGGPTIDPKQDGSVFRRSMYFWHSRDNRHPLLDTFDDADILACYRRSESVVPQQALALANSRLSIDMARRIAERFQMQIVGDPGPDKAVAKDAEARQDFVRYAFESILCRTPTAEEQQACQETLAELHKESQARNHAAPEQRARSGLVHALINHNDFITIR